MRILVLSFYYRPDLSAGSFRTTALVEEISRRLGDRGEVHVISTMPNRYRSFRAETPAHEVDGNVRIDRIELPVHRSGMADQSRAYASYARGVLRRIGVTGGYDLVFATSSRLMTAVLGARVARRLRAPLYLDIRDIFPDTLSDLFAGKPQRAVLPALRMLEAWAVRRAQRVNLVSPGFVPYFRAVRPDLEYRLFTNGIDQAFLDGDYHKPPGRPRIILYAGNIGEGQGLERVIPAAALRLGDGYQFWVVGDGGTRPRLAAAVERAGAENVRLMDPVPRDQLLTLYRQADVLFLHLNDYAAFRKVLPSKIFEYAATGKPMLAGVSGCARQFIQEHVENAALFDPCDDQGLAAALAALAPGQTPRRDFVRRFRRDEIIRRMAEDVLDLAGLPIAGDAGRSVRGAV